MCVDQTCRSQWPFARGFRRESSSLANRHKLPWAGRLGRFSEGGQFRVGYACLS